jgi:DNA-binding Xre family transcriptional regulator
MFTFNLQRIFNARNIKNGNQYLREKLGMSPGTATLLNRGESTVLNLRHLDTLCVNLNCTPNDLLQYYPTGQPLTEGHALNAMVRTKREELVKLIETLPMEKIDEIRGVVGL